MYREPISRPEPNGSIENGFPNNDLMLPRENGTDKIGFRIHFFTEQLSTPRSLWSIQTKGTLKGSI